MKEGAKAGMASSRARRTALAAMLTGKAVLVDTLGAEPEVETPGAEAVLGLSPEVRLSLEVVDDRVAMVLTTARGQRRMLSPQEQDLLRVVAGAPTLGDLAGAGRRGRQRPDRLRERAGRCRSAGGRPGAIVKMKPAAGRDEIDYVSRRARSLGFQVHESVDAGQVLLSLQGPMESVTPEALAGIRGVETVLPTRSSYRLASFDYRQERSVVSVGGVEIGGERVAVMAGPCAVETRDELIKTAWSVKESGATLLRGGAFKPRT